MKIRVDRSALAEALSRVKSTATNRQLTIQVCSYVKLSADDGTLTIESTDLTTSVRTQLPCDVQEPGARITPFEKLAATVNQMEEDELEFALEPDSGWLKIRAGNFNGRLLAADVDDMPKVEVGDVEGGIVMEGDEFAWLLQHGGAWVTTDQSRPVMTAVHLYTDGGYIFAESTDGHRVMRASTAVSDEHGALGGSGVLVPPRALSMVAGLLKNEAVHLGVSGDRLNLNVGATKIGTQLIIGEYPKVDGALTGMDDYVSAHLDVDVLKHAVGLVRLFAHRKTSLIRLSLKDDALEVYATNPDVGECKQVVPVEYDGEDASVGLNHAYVSAALNLIEGDEVAFQLSRNNPTLSPVSFADPSNDRKLMVVMPMRL